MPSFNAATVVEPLKYELRPYLDKDGVIREPSDAQIDAFDRAMTKERQRLRALIPDLPDEDDADAYQAALEKAELAQVSAEAFATWKNQAKAFAALCSGDPSEADLLALPRRVRLHFYVWLRQEVVSPEAGAGGGTAEVISLPSAAAG